MKTIDITSNEAGGRLDKFLFHVLPKAGKSFVYKMLRKKNITLNGKKADGSVILNEGDCVRLFFSDETFKKFSVGEGTAAGFGTVAHDDIIPIYEDDNILILNKPRGIESQSSSHIKASLNEQMLSYLYEKGEVTDESLGIYKPSVVNRLDTNTSGIVLCAKTPAASRSLSSMLKDRTLQKYYLCIVEGIVSSEDKISGWLLKENKSNKVKVFRDKCPGAKRIETAYRPLKTSENHTMLEVELITGKSHQIRAHLASIGHPICGDVKYGASKYGLNGQILCASGS